MKPWILLFTGLLGGGAIAGATFFTMNSAGGGTPTDAASASDVANLRTELEQLRKEHAELQSLANSMRTTAAATEVRQATVAPNGVKATESAPAVNVSPADRDVVFALIKEERDLREKERQEKQKQQLREGVEKRMKQTAERVGLDANTTASVVKLYLANLDRETEIRKAYAANGLDDPNAEKRKLEIEAARKDLDASLAGLIPADKKTEWDRSTRFMRRAGDFAAFTEADPGSGFLRGILGGGNGGGRPGGGQGDTNGGGGRRNNRQGQGNNANADGGASAPKPAAPVKQD